MISLCRCRFSHWGHRPWPYWTSLLLLCSWLVMPAAGCKKKPSMKEGQKGARAGQDLASLFAGDPESLAEYERIQRDIQGQNFQGAVEALEKMILKSPQAPWVEAVKFTMARTYMMMSDYRRALDLFDQFVKQYPSSSALPQALLFTGEIYLSMGADSPSGDASGSTARYYLQKSIGIFEDVIERFSTDRDTVAQAQYLIGSAHASMGDQDRAIQALQKVVDDYKDSPYAPKAMYRIAGIELSRGDVDRAEQSFGKLTAQYPNSFEAQKARKKLEGLGLVGTQALPLSVKEWVGKPPAEIGTLRDKVVVLSFWAIWCPHCRRNIPKMDQLVEHYAAKDLVVVGVTREKPGYEAEKIREFIKTHPMRFATGIDEDGKTSQAYAVSDIPCVVLIDRKGRIRWHGHPDFLQDGLLETLLAEVG
jgi:TolA-binding protein/peroxiredoxin